MGSGILGEVPRELQIKVFFRKLEKHGYIQGMSTSATNNEVKPKANMLNEEEDKGSQDAEFKTLISK